MGKFSIFHVIKDRVVHGVSLISISIEPPLESEKTNSDMQSILTSPSRETKIPLPSGILFPEKEKPSAADPLELNVKLLLAASPPEIFKIHPL